ncbi:DUF4870 domain-containing protein [Pontibacillus litoralis]|uniref:Membrane protein n=1 Tax=Pontibacillus litoralis JSM 072002 TaxID=1385512 RepID=A0A0A5HLC4_9BACI|nr:DUF4870 domain-containing protein [Pontibacillus litoralis]KGX84417.1 membrane protein [Pontibacillus litoralis JSM 072002]
MDSNKVIASLCYFSIFFAPVILPIVVYFVSEGETKVHAKKAFWSHIVPYLVLVTGFIVFGVVGITTNSGTIAGLSFITIFLIFGLLCLFYFIWNIIKGIQVLQGKA